MGAQPRWMGYVGVDDVDAATDQLKRLGGTVCMPPTDVPEISRFSGLTIRRWRHWHWLRD